jgi:hypothetical protein
MRDRPYKQPETKKTKRHDGEHQRADGRFIVVHQKLDDEPKQKAWAAQNKIFEKCFSRLIPRGCIIS